jgi:hypothetical protein
VKGESKVSSEKFKSCIPDQGGAQSNKEIRGCKNISNSKNQALSATVGMSEFRPSKDWNKKERL